MPIEERAAAQPWFSVVVPTRDRPLELTRALRSVLDQSYPSFELIVVDDGSEPPIRVALAGEPLAADRRIRWLALPRRPGGHGAPFARNTGAAVAEGRYVAMLDDDDLWTDTDHLERAHRVLMRAETTMAPADLYLANQHAYADDRRVDQMLWLDALGARLRAAKQAPSVADAHLVTVQELVAVGGFCHLNSTIIARALYTRLGGMDESLHYEEDRDFYLRAIDRADRILYVDVAVARHNVPDPRKVQNLSTALSSLEKRLHQLRLLGKASFDSRHDEVRHFALRHRGYTLKKAAEDLSAAGRWREASAYAREALGLAPTLKWLAYTLRLHSRWLLRR
jgi:glycosyltransferase involved in cell wall biosynthesis